MEPLFALLLVLAIAGAFFWVVGAICCAMVRMFVGLFRAVFGLGGQDANAAGMHARHIGASGMPHGQGMATGQGSRRCTNRNCGQTNPAEACYCGRCGAVLSRGKRGISEWVRL